MQVPRPEFFQGVRDFSNFKSYLNDWLIPNTLGDLETIFFGATEYWRSDQRRPRGNFMLATLLMAVMDHIGSFLRKPEDPMTSWKHISLCAKLLPSVSDVHGIIGYCGRNALIHEAWPTTMLVIEDGKSCMRFGLNINANADITLEHRKLYWKRYVEPLPKVRGHQEVLKFRLNIYTVLHDLGHAMRNWNVRVDQNTFDQVNEHSGSLCHFKVRQLNESEREKLKINDPGIRDTMKLTYNDSNDRKPDGKFVEILSEIRYLYEKAPAFGDELILPIVHG